MFSYINDLDKKYDNTIENIKSVTFDISRFSGLKHTIKFKTPTTMKKAIQVVQEYLSKPLTKYWFNKIQKSGDFNLKDEKWNAYKNGCRGELLGGAIYLETAKLDEKGNLLLECGS